MGILFNVNIMFNWSSKDYLTQFLGATIGAAAAVVMLTEVPQDQ